jgi:hypothetical protein
MGENLINIIGNILTLLFLGMGVDHILANQTIPHWLAVSVVIVAIATIGTRAFKEIAQNLWDLYYG